MSSSSFSPAAAAAAASAASATHILVFPYPAQGHMLALLDLTQQLALKGLTITILVTPKNLRFLDPILSSQPSIRTLILPFPNHPKLPVGVENVKDIGNHGNTPIIAALANLRGPLIQWFKSHPSPPQAILSDFFLGWTNNSADELNIPRIAFFSSSSFLACVSSYLWLHIDTVRHLPVVEFPDLPGSPSFIQAHTPSMFRHYRDSDSDWEVVRDGVIANLSSWGIIFNSFSALEGDYLEHMKKKSVHGRVYGVGPLTLLAGSERLNRVNPDSETKYGVLKWLDNQPEGSVLYVCFGSQKLLTTAQMEALASGLEHSMTRFIWVVRSGFSGKVEGEEGHGTVPGGFEERVGCRGLVIKWAPQVEILSHRAVGGFLSHCGWNSVLESVAAGVMILAWPTEADQFVNARLLVDDLGVAVRVCEGGDAAPDSVELARIISESLSGNVPQKERAKALREKTLEAAKAGGSSSTAMDELVEELRHL